MVKHTTRTMLGAALILGVLLSLFACLNPIGFDPDKLPSIDINLSGQISTEDVTAATLYVVNLSKTVDFKQVSIKQPLNPKAADPVAQFPNTQDAAGNWKKVKTKYLQASDIEYEIGIQYTDNQHPGADRIQSTDVYATQSKGLYYVYIYRAKNGDVVVISPNNPNTTPDSYPEPDPSDNLNINVNVGAPQVVIENAVQITINNNLGGPIDPDEGEGSVPSVIPPANRTKMATFVVKNMTSSMRIDNTTFSFEAKAFSMPEINTRDKNTIALGQGTWATTVHYNTNKSTRTINSVIVPSNDPQSIKEHYLYFYLNNRGEYDITDTYPPKDLAEEDVLPPDNGHGRGLIKIVNKSTGMAVGVTLTDYANQDQGLMSIPWDHFMPDRPVQYNQTGYVPVVGDVDFPITATYYLVQVAVETNDFVVSVNRKAYLKDTVVEIIITQDDIKDTTAKGAKVALQNRVDSWPIEIVGMMVMNKVYHSQSAAYDMASWSPAGAVSNGSNATQYVISSTGMPILEDGTFEARITIRGNNRTAVVTKPFMQGGAINDSLYGNPLTTERIVTIVNADVPPELKEIFVNVSGVDIASGLRTVLTHYDSGETTITGGGFLNLSGVATVLPVDASVKGPITWSLYSGNGGLIDMTRLTNYGYIQVTGKSGGIPGSDTSIQVVATIPDAIGTMVGGVLTTSDYHSTPITISLNYDKDAPPFIPVTGITVTGGGLSIPVGSTADLRDYVSFTASGTPTPTKNDLVWAIVPPDNGNVTLSGYTVTGVKMGTQQVRVTLPEAANPGAGGGMKSATFTVTVTAPPHPNTFTIRVIQQNKTDWITEAYLVLTTFAQWPAWQGRTDACTGTANALPHLNSTRPSVLLSGHTGDSWTGGGNPKKSVLTKLYPTPTKSASIGIKGILHTKDITDIAWPADDAGYQLWFIEGDGYTRGYCAPGAYPTPNNNKRFFIHPKTLHDQGKFIWMVGANEVEPGTPNAMLVLPVTYNSYYNTTGIGKSQGVGKTPIHDAN